MSTISKIYARRFICNFVLRLLSAGTRFAPLYAEKYHHTRHETNKNCQHEAHSNQTRPLQRRHALGFLIRITRAKCQQPPPLQFVIGIHWRRHPTSVPVTCKTQHTPHIYKDTCTVTAHTVRAQDARGRENGQTQNFEIILLSTNPSHFTARDRGPRQH